MKKLDEKAQRAVSDRISEIEQTCESELVCLVTKSSARYVLFPMLIAALLALLMPVLQVIVERAGFGGVNITFQHQTVVFLALAVIFVFTPLRHMLTPKWLRHQNCVRYSTELFFNHNLHETKMRNAILIFVSWDEKFVTIVADRGINEKTPQSDWDQLIADFIKEIKSNRIEDGFLQIVAGAGALLVKNFPVQAPRKDELPNHLIELGTPPYIS